MSKASEAKLGELHGAVADLLTETIRNGVVVGVSEAGQPIRATAPAAYVVAALAMLKNNNITADPGANTALSGLEQALAAKRANGKMAINARAQALEEAERQLERDLGGFVQ